MAINGGTKVMLVEAADELLGLLARSLVEGRQAFYFEPLPDNQAEFIIKGAAVEAFRTYAEDVGVTLLGVCPT